MLAAQCCKPCCGEPGLLASRRRRWLLYRPGPARAGGLVADRNDDHFFMQGSGPLTLPVRSADTVPCHRAPRCGLTGRPWRRVWRIYR